MSAQMAARRLWSRKLTGGAEVTATLWHDTELSEATLEITVSDERAEPRAEKIANAICEALDRHGAVQMEERV
jgi:hypothetical protein